MVLEDPGPEFDRLAKLISQPSLSGDEVMPCSTCGIFIWITALGIVTPVYHNITLYCLAVFGGSASCLVLQLWLELSWCQRGQTTAALQLAVLPIISCVAASVHLSDCTAVHFCK